MYHVTLLIGIGRSQPRWHRAVAVLQLVLQRGANPAAVHLCSIPVPRTTVDAEREHRADRALSGPSTQQRPTQRAAERQLVPRFPTHTRATHSHAAERVRLTRQTLGQLVARRHIYPPRSATRPSRSAEHRVTTLSS